MTNNFSPFVNLMTSAGLDKSVIETFRCYYEKLCAGDSGKIAEDEIAPLGPGSIKKFDELSSFRESGIASLDKCAVIKLNGGLGTSMGLSGPKSALVVKNGLSFFDIAAKQVEALNSLYKTRVPFVTMDSFSTATETAAMRSSHKSLPSHIAPSFLQNKYPKVLAGSLDPAVPDASQDNGWNPPGHGDFYAALNASGLLDKMISVGIDFAFVSNIDNCGATLSPELLGYMAQSGAEFLMEVAVRTEMDKKGGHLAKSASGGLVLRERAQAIESEIESFEDISRYGYFNTNSIWLNLHSVKDAINSHGGVLPLPLIVNRKRLVPKDDSTPEIIQLETAIGAAISLFAGAAAIEVPRTRFAPVKNCEDLLVVRSDRFILNKLFELEQVADCTKNIIVKLDDNYFGTIGKFSDRFTKGEPSLKRCTRFDVLGNVSFGKEISVIGDVKIQAHLGESIFVPDSSKLTK